MARIVTDLQTVESTETWDWWDEVTREAMIELCRLWTADLMEQAIAELWIGEPFMDQSFLGDIHIFNPFNPPRSDQ